MTTLRDYVDVYNPGDVVEDSHGNTSDDWTGQPIRESAQINPLGGTVGSTSENLAGGDVVTSRMRVTLDGVTSVTPFSRLGWNGKTWEVDGAVVPVPGHRGRIHHHVAIIKVIEG